MEGSERLGCATELCQGELEWGKEGYEVSSPDCFSLVGLSPGCCVGLVLL